MSKAGRYAAAGPETEYQSGTRGRVLRNFLGIVRVRDMEQPESDALVITQNSLDQYTLAHRFTAGDIRSMHRQWLGGIYSWAGEYRSINVRKADFMFAAADRIPQLMASFQRNELRMETPCAGMDLRATSKRARAHARRASSDPSLSRR